MTSDNGISASSSKKWAWGGGVLATAFLGLATLFNASAHVPEKGKNAFMDKQHDLLQPYKDFIMTMKKEGGGSCCSLQDGRGNLEEKIEKKNGKDTYKVKITHDLGGEPLPGGGIWIDIPPSAILTTEHAKAVCKESSPGSTTCKPPGFNILWASMSRGGGGYDDEGNPTAATGPLSVNVFCYYPKPKVM